MNAPLIAPSIIAGDMGRLADATRFAAEAGADWIHLDVMDGHFVPNLTFGPGTVAALRPVSRLPFDVHLMIEEPERWVAEYIRAGADTVTVHVEASLHLDRTLGRIRQLGARAGVALNPATPVEALRHVWQAADLILVMSVNPGFAGQKFIPEALTKLAAVKEEKERRGWPGQIEVDGGINAATARQAIAAGAEILVAGSAVYGQKDLRGAMTALRDIHS